MIHPTAQVDPGARLGARVSVGAYSIIGPEVDIGDGTSIGPHCAAMFWWRSQRASSMPLRPLQSIV